MKTFSEFLEEAASYNKHPHFSTKEELIAHYKEKGGIPSGMRIKSRGTKVAPSYGLTFTSTTERAKTNRDKNIEISTGKLTKEQEEKVNKKIEIKKNRKMDLHHGSDVKTSGDVMGPMSPGERLRFKATQAKQHTFHGNDPRNLVLGNTTDISKFSPHTPGFEHNKFHPFERKHGAALRDLPISKMRAYTTLVNAERKTARREKLDKARRERTLPKLQARMAKAYDRITGLPPEKPKPQEQTSNSSTPRVPSPRKIGSRNVSPPRKIGSRNVPPPIRK